MPSEERRRGGLGFPNGQFADGLDEVARGLAAGTISRRRALKMTGAALLGAALVPFSSAPAEAQEGTCSNRPAISNRRCPHPEAICHESATQICACAKTVRGNKRCVEIREGCALHPPCERNRDCAEGEICVKIGACCGIQYKGCARPCDFT